MCVPNPTSSVEARSARAKRLRYCHEHYDEALYEHRGEALWFSAFSKYTAFGQIMRKKYANRQAFRIIASKLQTLSHPVPTFIT
eukprot:907120-Pelagomonas_calceolata.AAC.1